MLGCSFLFCFNILAYVYVSSYGENIRVDKVVISWCRSWLVMWWIPWWTREKWWGEEKHGCCWKGVSNELNFGVDLYGLVTLVLWVVVLQTISRLPLSLLYETFVCILCNKVEGCWKMMTKLGLTCSCEEIGKWGIQGKPITKWNDITIIVVMGKSRELSMFDIWYHRNGVYIKIYFVILVK